MTGAISPIETLLRSISNLDVEKSLDHSTKSELLKRADDLESIAKGIRDYAGQPNPPAVNDPS